MKTTRMLILAAALAAGALPARAGGDASDGHVHAAPAALPQQDSAPRAAAFSADFEAVAVLADGRLLLYLDRFATNEPVAGAKLEIDGAFKGVAAETAPGIYALAAAAPPAVAGQPLRLPLTIGIETADGADLLSATLELAPAVPTAHAHGWSEWVAWLGAGAVALAAVALLAVRRRKQHKGANR